jgi:hypothetical protein
MACKKYLQLIEAERSVYELECELQQLGIKVGKPALDCIRHALMEQMEPLQDQAYAQLNRTLAAVKTARPARKGSKASRTH